MEPERPTRIPLNTFAIGFGLAGLAEAWSATSTTLHLPDVVAQAFWAIAAVGFGWLLIAHAVRGRRSGTRLATQLQHPVQGPLAALVPITAMLLADDLAHLAPLAGAVAFGLALTASTLFAGWLIARWMQGGLPLEAVHGGYLLPTVAAGFVGADVAAALHWTALAVGLLAVGAFFWLAMTVLVAGRLMFRAPLANPLVPTMAILVAPPAVAGVAWFVLTGLVCTVGAAAIAGLGVLLLVVQIALVPRYRRLRFSLGFWSFTFPTAAVVTDAVLWVRLAAFPGWQGAIIALISALTVLVAAIGARSLGDVVRHAHATASVQHDAAREIAPAPVS